MSLHDDSGQPQRTPIAACVVEQLRAHVAEQMPYVRHVGQLAEAPERRNGGGDVLRQVWRGAHPTLWVVLGDAESDEFGMQIAQELWRKTIELAVFVVVEHKRTGQNGQGPMDADVVARSDKGKDPGVRALCEHVEDLLMGWQMDEPDVGELDATGEERWLVEGALHIWRLRFMVAAWRVVTHGRTAAPSLDAVNVSEHVYGDAVVTQEIDLQCHGDAVVTQEIDLP